MFRMKTLIAAVVLFHATAFRLPGQVTSFSFTSSPTSYIGGGQSRFITPEDGHTFNIYTRDGGSAVRFYITDFSNPLNYDTWDLRFSTGDGSLFEPSTSYLDAQRYPFNGDSPGLSFSGNGRGNNTLTGYFTVLAAVYDQNNILTSFAADFMQFEDGITENWDKGEIRYNYVIPEPTTASCLGLAAAVLFLRRRKLAFLPAPRSKPSAAFAP